MKTLAQIFNDVSSKVREEGFLNHFETKNHPHFIDLIHQSLHEAKIAVEFLTRYDLHNKQVLEIGAGSGIVSACLHLAGAHVTMVEPSAGVFSHQEKIAKALHHTLNIHIPLLQMPVEHLQSLNEQFDFIFSINVLEHIMNLPQAFSVMSRLLKDSGVMFHTCPNYAIPYEPHTGVVLFPFFPRVSLLLSKKLKSHPVSGMLNFITAGGIKKLARRNHMVVHFYKDTVYRSFMRFTCDSYFTARQSGIPLTLFKVLKTLKIVHATKYLPVCLQTPVAFEMKKSVRHKS